MSTEYERVLREWALAMVPADTGAVRVTDVDIWYDPGFGGSDVTEPDDPSLFINICYVTQAGETGTYRSGYDGPDTSAVRMSELLQALFRIAEADR